MQIKDISGQRFGRLTAIRLLSERDYSGGAIWLCRCACGQEKALSLRRIRALFSCGCYGRERHLKHGRGRRGAIDRTYAIWHAMRVRCGATRGRNWENYGRRGIAVCERWASFDSFLADMGNRPDGMSLDRIDNDRGYEPDNCRWATRIQQMGNTRASIRVELDGEVVSASEASRRLQIPVKRLRFRIAEHGDPRKPHSKEALYG